LLEDESNLLLIQKHAITPNQNGQFQKIIDSFNRISLYVDAIQDNDLVYILELLDEDWKDILLHEKMNYVRCFLQEKEKKDIAVKITEILNKELRNFSHNNNGNFVS